MEETLVHIQSFLDYLKFEKRYSQHTIIAYKKDISQFLDFITTEYEIQKLNEVSTSVVRSWMANLKNKHKDTNKTIHRKMSSVKSLYKFLLRKKITDKSPADALTLPKIQKRLPEFLKESEVEKMLLTKEDSNKKELSSKDIWRNRTKELATEFFYATGMRLSELVNLKEKDIDLVYQQVKVLGKGSKERIIPLPAHLLNEIKKYIDDKPTGSASEFFVNEKGEKLYAKFFYIGVKKQMINSDVKLKKKSPHILRHTFATHLLNEGADINAIKELLGHSNLAATQVYTHNTIEKLKEVYKKAHPKAK